VFLWLALTVFLLSAQTLLAEGGSISAADEKKFELAMSALNRNDYTQAELLLRELHAHYPAIYQINESLGLSYAAQNQLKAALPFLKLAAEEQPKESAARANLGTIYLKLGRNAEAATELEQAAQLDSDNAQTEAALGQVWMLLNQPQKASAAFTAALRNDAQNPDLAYNGALAFFNAGDVTSAATLLSRISAAQSSALSESLYGDVEEKLGHYKEAAEHYVNAARLDPTEANMYALGLEFLRHWTFGPAVKQFETGVKQYPSSMRMRFGLGLAYYVNSNYDRAISVLAELLSAEPGNAMYAELLGRTCSFLTEGTDPKCSAVIDFSEKHPQNASVATYAAISILHLAPNPQRLEIARHLLEAAIRHNPSLPEAHYQMGMLLQEEEQWQQSVPELEAAVRGKPDYAQAHYRLALAYSRTGRKKEANNEVVLQHKYRQQETHDLDAKLNEITTLLVTMK
jgi:tetratricopeptide (TPR) repeat protein